jgi:hypothetical protein
VKVLLKALPPEAAVHRSDPELGGWTITDHLLASAIDALGVVSYHALVGPHADPKKLRGVKPPPRITRPGVRPERRKATSDDLKRMFGGAAAYRPKEVS